MGTLRPVGGRRDGRRQVAFRHAPRRVGDLPVFRDFPRLCPVSVGPGLDCIGGHHVHAPTEDFPEFLTQLTATFSERRTFSPVVEPGPGAIHYVDVAVGSEIVAQHRAEEGELGDPVRLAERTQLLRADVETLLHASGDPDGPRPRRFDGLLRTRGVSHSDFRGFAPFLTGRRICRLWVGVHACG